MNIPEPVDLQLLPKGRTNAAAESERSQPSYLSPFRWRWIQFITRRQEVRFLYWPPRTPTKYRNLRMYDRAGYEIGRLVWVVCDDCRVASINKISIVPDHPRQPSTEAEEPGGNVVDLMAALQESVRKGQAARGEGAGDAEVHEMPTAKKKTAGKAPAKKTAKKTATSKKPGPAAAGRPGRSPVQDGEVEVSAVT
ncbi:hypothetical protein [Streptomyces sp. NPDC058297]|uniref:hypothetical protein n=1 Tax=Streptomyces sp. NPDC058297 TaxID=3346433 RepID=UPI0036F007AF